MIKGGLILEGGGMRGVYTSGALDFLEDEGLRFSDIYGVSAGACVACSYLSGQRGRAFRTMADYCDDPNYKSFRSFLKTGDFFNVQMAYYDIPNKLLPFDNDAYKNSGQRLFCAMTDCETGTAEYRLVSDPEKDIVLVQASSSLPLLSKMVKIDGRLYLDGGITDPIPAAKALADGIEKMLVVLTRHRGYIKKKDSMLPLMWLRYRKYPKLLESLTMRHIQYNAALELVYRLEAEGKAVIIQPKEKVKIGRLEKSRALLNELYEQGYQDAKDLKRKIMSMFA